MSQQRGRQQIEEPEAGGPSVSPGGSEGRAAGQGRAWMDVAGGADRAKAGCRGLDRPLGTPGPWGSRRLAPSLTSPTGLFSPLKVPCLITTHTRAF